MWINVRKPVLIEAGNNVCYPHVRGLIVVSPPQTTVSAVGEFGARLVCRVTDVRRAKFDFGHCKYPSGIEKTTKNVCSNGRFGYGTAPLRARRHVSP